MPFIILKYINDCLIIVFTIQQNIKEFKTDANSYETIYFMVKHKQFCL